MDIDDVVGGGDAAASWGKGFAEAAQSIQNGEAVLGQLAGGDERPVMPASPRNETVVLHKDNPWLDLTPIVADKTHEFLLHGVIVRFLPPDGYGAFEQEAVVEFLPLSKEDHDMLFCEPDCGYGTGNKHAIVDVARLRGETVFLKGAFQNHSPLGMLYVAARLRRSPGDICALEDPPTRLTERYTGMEKTLGVLQVTRVYVADHFMMESLVQGIAYDWRRLLLFVAQTGAADDILDRVFIEQSLSVGRGARAVVPYVESLLKGTRQGGKPLKLSARVRHLEPHLKVFEEIFRPFAGQRQLDIYYSRLEHVVKFELAKRSSGTNYHLQQSFDLAGAAIFSQPFWDTVDTYGFAGRVLGYPLFRRIYSLSPSLGTSLLRKLASNKIALPVLFLRALEPTLFSLLGEEISALEDFVRVVPVQFFSTPEQVALAVRTQRSAVAAQKLYHELLHMVEAGTDYATLAWLLYRAGEIDYQSGDQQFLSADALLVRQPRRSLPQGAIHPQREFWAGAIQMLVGDEASLEDMRVFEWTDQSKNVVTLGFIRAICRDLAERLAVYIEGGKVVATDIAAADPSRPRMGPPLSIADPTAKRTRLTLMCSSDLPADALTELPQDRAMALLMKLIELPLGDSPIQQRLILGSYSHTVPNYLTNELMTRFCEVFNYAGTRRVRAQTLVLSASYEVMRSADDVCFNTLSIATQLAVQDRADVRRVIVLDAHYLSVRCLSRLVQLFHDCKVFCLLYDRFYDAPLFRRELIIDEVFRKEESSLMFGHAIKDLLAVMAPMVHLPLDPWCGRRSLDVARSLMDSNTAGPDAAALQIEHVRVVTLNDASSDLLNDYAVSLLGGSNSAEFQRAHTMVFVLIPSTAYGGANARGAGGASGASPSSPLHSHPLMDRLVLAIEDAAAVYKEFLQSSEPPSSFDLNTDAPWASQLLRQYRGSQTFCVGDIVRWKPEHQRPYTIRYPDAESVAVRQSTLPVLSCSLYQVREIRVTSTISKDDRSRTVAHIDSLNMMDKKEVCRNVYPTASDTDLATAVCYIHFKLQAVDELPDTCRRLECSFAVPRNAAPVGTGRPDIFSPFEHAILLRTRDLYSIAKIGHIAVLYDTKAANGAHQVIETTRLVAASFDLLTDDWPLARDKLQQQCRTGRQPPDAGTSAYYAPFVCELRNATARLRRTVAVSSAAAAAQSDDRPIGILGQAQRGTALKRTFRV